MSPARKSKANALPEDWNYETEIQKIEQIVEQLETADLPLEQVFSDFSEAVQILQQCDKFLKDKQAQATLLIETLGDDGAA